MAHRNSGQRSSAAPSRQCSDMRSSRRVWVALLLALAWAAAWAPAPAAGARSGVPEGLIERQHSGSRSQRRGGARPQPNNSTAPPLPGCTVSRGARLVPHCHLPAYCCLTIPVTLQARASPTSLQRQRRTRQQTRQQSQSSSRCPQRKAAATQQPAAALQQQRQQAPPAALTRGLCWAAASCRCPARRRWRRLRRLAQ